MGFLSQTAYGVEWTRPVQFYSLRKGNISNKDVVEARAEFLIALEWFFILTADIFVACNVTSSYFVCTNCTDSNYPFACLSLDTKHKFLVIYGFAACSPLPLIPLVFRAFGCVTGCNFWNNLIIKPDRQSITIHSQSSIIKIYTYRHA